MCGTDHVHLVITGYFRRIAYVTSTKAVKWHITTNLGGNAHFYRKRAPRPFETTHIYYLGASRTEYYLKRSRDHFSKIGG